MSHQKINMELIEAQESFTAQKAELHRQIILILKDRSLSITETIQKRGIRGERQQLAKAMQLTTPALSKMLERTRFDVSFEKIPPLTTYMIGKLLEESIPTPGDTRKKLSDATPSLLCDNIHSFWFGVPCPEYNVPRKLNVFAYCCRFFGTEEFELLSELLDKTENKHSKSLSPFDLLSERLREYWEEEGKKAPSSLRSKDNELFFADYPNLSRIANFILEGGTEDKLSEQNFPTDLRVRSIMLLSYILNLPMDYFLEEDYLSRTFDSAIFSTPDGMKYRMPQDTQYKKVLRPLFRKFISLTPEGRQELTTKAMTLYFAKKL